jgi:hypothetical protein
LRGGKLKAKGKKLFMGMMGADIILSSAEVAFCFLLSAFCLTKKMI